MLMKLTPGLQFQSNDLQILDTNPIFACFAGLHGFVGSNQKSVTLLHWKLPLIDNESQKLDRFSYTKIVIIVIKRSNFEEE